jgi:zinc transporter ZupT
MAKSKNRFSIFKTLTFKWWQVGLFKWGMLTLGVAVGTYWYGFFAPYLAALLGFAAICLLYITYLWWKQ